MPRNERASSDARHARTGKDAAIYNGDGVLLATVDSFTAQASYNNASYAVLGDPQEHHSANTYGITITMSKVKVESDQFMDDILASMNDPNFLPYWTLQGTILGRNGSEERVVYPECVPDGNVDIQNITTGDVIKEQISMFCNGKPVKVSNLTLD